MRPESLERLLASFPPNLSRITEDTQGNLSAGRNRLIDKCPTEYFLLLEDDFEFTPRTSPAIMRSILEQDQQIAGVSGHVLDKDGPPRGLRHCFDKFAGDISLRRSWYPWRATEEGVPYLPCHITHNFIMFRTDFVRRVRWNEDLPVWEHAEFFWRALQEQSHLMAFCPEVEINHHQDRPGGEYDQLRNRQVEKSLKTVHTDAHVPPPPCFVVATAGHTGSRVVTRAIQAIFSVKHDLDDGFGEVASLRQSIVDHDVDAFAKTLHSMPKPWVVKAPQMIAFWRRLMRVFAAHEPTLILSTRCSKKILQSHRKRGNSRISFEDIERRAMMAAEWYHAWPWRKIELDLDAIAGFARSFDPARALQDDTT
jgi:hypothetical protein